MRGSSRIYDWAAWLAEGDEPQRLEILRRNVEKGLPCGSGKFIQKLAPPFPQKPFSPLLPLFLLFPP